ncbi:peptidylprolyl isomerase [Futiania mangrovi]|uniref:Parvulin-like PPIase n=1 Tax=Futiania mangrovi TaxID=2959716 RepID=A0A9J6PDB2_9PROT|nr:peptidylprolyl isomerase [Futiania mangrovii]MCP1336601.1 peptidylprolyl isomerase [Futiania mangrovii]
MNKPLFPDVVVNGVTIPARAIAAEAQNHAAPKGKPGWAWHAAARALAVRELLRQEASRAGIAPEPRALPGGRIETDEEAVLRALLDRRLSACPPSEEEVRAVYDANPERFVSPALFEASHILFADDTRDVTVRPRARKRAAAVLAEIARDPGAFERIARAESDCPSRANGGMLGQLAEGDTVPEFEAVLKAIEPGTVAPEPVETRYGVHVLRLDARADGAVLPFEAVRDRIAAAIERRRWAGEARAFVERLVSVADVQGVVFAAADRATSSGS